MALGDDYITAADLRTRLGVTVGTEDAILEAAATAASRAVETHCRRQFNLAATATPRRYRPDTGTLLTVDDIATTTGLLVEVDNDGDGEFETTWTAADYELEPLDGVVDGVEGWPFWTLRAVGSRRWPCSDRATVRVTAQWGWQAVPAPVVEATKIVASELYKLKDAPLGVAGFGDFGVVRVRENPMAATKLAPYVRDAILVA